MNFESLVHQILRPIQARLSQMISRGRVTAVDDDQLQVQFQKEEIQDGIERFESFGFSSNPGEDPEALILFPDGYRSNGIAIALRQKSAKKKKLSSGAASMSASDGTSVTVEKGGRISIRNDHDELISILIELIDKINSLSIIIPTVQANLPSPSGAASGPIVIANGSIDSSSKSSLGNIQTRLKTFQAGET